MSIGEYTIWSLMAGGLLSLTLLALVDAVVTRSLGAARNVLLIFALSATSVLLSGLPELLLPALPPPLFLLLKTALPSLTGALGLHLTDIWLGGDREDHLSHHLTLWGCCGLLLTALVLPVAAVRVAPGDEATVLLLSAASSALMAVLMLTVAVRGTLLGDPLARWLVLACLILVGMLTGLYLRALNVPMGLGWQFATAVSTVLFILIVMVLIIVRNRTSRRLARLARLETGVDPATGLPTGARLLSEVEHAFWRTGRLRGKCVVVAVHLGNLYELGEALGRTGEQQILTATAARIRRAAGFRCVVGLYHPRCFIIVFSVDRKRVVDDSITRRIQSLMTAPMSVLGSNDRHQQFVPQIGVSMLTVWPDHVEPQAVINEVEHLAMDIVRDQSQPEGDDAVTVWPPQE